MEQVNTVQIIAQRDRVLKVNNQPTLAFCMG